MSCIGLGFHEDALIGRLKWNSMYLKNLRVEHLPRRYELQMENGELRGDVRTNVLELMAMVRLRMLNDFADKAYEMFYYHLLNCILNAFNIHTYMRLYKHHMRLHI